MVEKEKKWSLVCVSTIDLDSWDTTYTIVTEGLENLETTSIRHVSLDGPLVAKDPDPLVVNHTK